MQDQSVLVLNAGSSSLKYQVRRPRPSGSVDCGRPPGAGGRDRRADGAFAELDRAAARRPGSSPTACSRSGTGWSTAAPRYTAPVVARRRRRAPRSTELARPRSAAQPAGGGRHPPRPGGVPGPAPGRGLRHRVLRRPARPPRRRTRSTRELAEREGIRRYGMHGISHAYVAAEAAGFLGRPLDELRPDRAAPRQRRLGGRDPRRPPGGHLDGPDAARGPGDGHPRRRPRPRACCCTCCATATRRRRAGGPAAPPVRAAGPGRACTTSATCSTAVDARRRARPDGVRRLLPPAAQVRRRLPGRARRRGRRGVHRRGRRARARGPRGRPAPAWARSASRSTRPATGRCATGARRISTDSSRVDVLVVPTDEELAIARQVAAAGSADRPRLVGRPRAIGGRGRRRRPARRPAGGPGPVAHLGQVLAVLAGPRAGPAPGVDHLLPQRRGARAQPGHPVDDVHDQVVPVEVVHHHHVERRGGGALLLVAAHVEVVRGWCGGRSAGGSATGSRGRRRSPACRW